MLNFFSVKESSLHSAQENVTTGRCSCEWRKMKSPCGFTPSTSGVPWLFLTS